MGNFFRPLRLLNYFHHSSHKRRGSARPQAATALAREAVVYTLVKFKNETVLDIRKVNYFVGILRHIFCVAATTFPVNHVETVDVRKTLSATSRGRRSVNSSGWGVKWQEEEELCYQSGPDCWGVVGGRYRKLTHCTPDLWPNKDRVPHVVVQMTSGSPSRAWAYCLPLRPKKLKISLG